MRITLKLSIALIGLSIFASLSLKWVLDDPERLRASLAAQLQRATGYSVYFQTLDWQLLPHLALNVTALRIPADPAAQPFAEIEDLSVDIELMPLLLEGALTIDSIEISTLSLNLIDFENGSTNYRSEAARDNHSQGEGATTQPEAPMLPNLNKLEVDRLQIRYQDEVIKQVIDLRADNLTGQLSEGMMTVAFNDVLHYSDSHLPLEFEGKVKGAVIFSPSTSNLTIDDLKAEGQLRAIDLPATAFDGSLSGRYDITHDLATITALNIGYLGLQSQLNGQLNGLTEPEIGLDLSVRADLIKPQALNGILAGTDVSSLSLDEFNLSSRILGTDIKPQLTELSGAVNRTDFEGDAALDQAYGELILNLQMGNLDLTPVTIDSGPQSSTPTPLDPATVIVPLDVLDAWVFNVQLRAKEILWNGLRLEDAGLALRNVQGKLSADIIGKLNTAPLAVNLQIDYDNEPLTTANAKLSEFDLITVLPNYNLGRMSLETSLEFKGATLGDLTSSLQGPMVISLAEGLLNIAALKQAALVIDQLSGTQSGAANWPDQLAFDELLGNISHRRGIASEQYLTLEYQNLSLRARGGIDIYSGVLDYALALKVSESTTPPLKASGPLTQVSWPAQCQGAMDLPVTRLCQIDRGQSRALMEELARNALKKKAADLLDKTLQDKAPEALKGLLRGILGK